MRLLALLAAGLFAGTLIAADDKKDEKKVKDEEAIVGKWKAEKFDSGGSGGPPAEKVGNITMTFSKDGKMAMTDVGGSVSVGTFTLDPAAKPKTLDITILGSTAPAVYELDGDTLRVCLTSGEKPKRPTELKADGKSISLVTFKRVKNEKKEEKKDK